MISTIVEMQVYRNAIAKMATDDKHSRTVIITAMMITIMKVIMMAQVIPPGSPWGYTQC